MPTTLAILKILTAVLVIGITIPGIIIAIILVIALYKITFGESGPPPNYPPY